MSGATEKKLNSLQQWYVRLVLQVGPGAKSASLLWDFGFLDMGLRIWVEKVMLMLHISRLGDGTLAGKVYKEQKLKKWPGLVKETEVICSELSVQSVHSTKLSAKVYRSKVVNACHRVNEQRLKNQADGKTKCAKITEEKYGKKNYISDSKIHNVREMYKGRYKMMPYAGNYQRDRRFARTEWLCRCGESKEEEQHIMSGNCEVYGEIRSAYTNLNNDEQLVSFLLRCYLKEMNWRRKTSLIVLIDSSAQVVGSTNSPLILLILGFT